jgi:hypothetical protein
VGRLAEMAAQVELSIVGLRRRLKQLGLR